MSVNKNMGLEQYKQTLKSVFPTQFEPGSLADRLLIQGRAEGERSGLEKGKLAGKIQMLQELLGAIPTTEGELQSLDVDTLATRLADLQQRLRDHQA